MKLKPIKNDQDYLEFSNYINSLCGKEISEEQSNEILIIQQLLEHYDQNKNSEYPLINQKLKEDFDYIYELVQNVAGYEKFGLIERVCKLQEEVGELSAETLKLIGFKNSNLSESKIKENILLESVDCLIMCMDILSTCGYTKEQIIKVADAQINKWISNLKIT
jgi:hypothetical protein